MGIAVKPLCSTEILFLSLTEMKQRLLSLPVENVLLIMGKEAADWWSLHSFLKENGGPLPISLAPDRGSQSKPAGCQGGVRKPWRKPLDAIVAIGGGSVIDLAKAISAFL